MNRSSGCTVMCSHPGMQSPLCPTPCLPHPCPPLALRSKFYQYWHKCNMLPEDAHPKSLRSAFPYNTNIWASKNASLIRVGPPTGMFSLDQVNGGVPATTRPFLLVMLLLLLRVGPLPLLVSCIC